MQPQEKNKFGRSDLEVSAFGFGTAPVGNIFEEIDEKTSDEWKSKNLDEIQKRMTGWQLESFKESYEHKIKKGISLFKKDQIK